MPSLRREHNHVGPVVPVDDLEGFWTDDTELRATLSEPVPRIPPVFGYDERGSQLFEQITRLPTYWLTRVEWELLLANAQQIVRVLDGARFVELGSGSAKKTRALLAAGAPHRVAEYLPVDVSREMLVASPSARSFSTHRADQMAASHDRKQATFPLAKTRNGRPLTTRNRPFRPSGRQDLTCAPLTPRKVLTFH